jgi:hypothetical protein
VPPVGTKVALHDTALAVHMVLGHGMEGPAIIVNGQDTVIETPAASVTVTLTFPLNAALGVPDSTPVAVLKVNPPNVLLMAYV